MSETYPFNTPSGQTIAREKLISYLNTGTSSVPVWSPIGAWVTDSSMEFDYSEESSQDILGETHSSMKKPIIKQTFDPTMLDSGNAAIVQIWHDAIENQDVQALAAKDILVAHIYTGFGERYSACMVKPVSLGGEGGGSIGMGFEVTYGGTRTKGAVTVSDGVPTFTPESEPEPDPDPDPDPDPENPDGP